MWRSRTERERNRGEALGLAGALVLLLCTTEIVICNGRALHVMSSSRRLLQDNSTSSSDGNGNGNGNVNLRQYWWIFLVVPAFFVSLLFLMTVCFKFHLEKRRRLIGKKEIIYTKSPWKVGMTRTMRKRLKKVIITELPINTREELEHECEEFSNIISSSSDSVVFKGTRDSGAQIAVARVRIPPSRWSCNSELHFLRKVKDLARMKHANIVNLLAYCSEDEPFERMLVYEYTPNGSVYDHLHSSGSPADFLDWSTRMKILMGAAYGLKYMHTDLDPPATHMKFDASSVFLTECYSAKVASYGMDKLCVGSNSLGRRQSFGRIVKSVGYEDWDRYRHVPKQESNVLSFGMFMLEMISGRCPYDPTEGSILLWAAEYMESNEKLWQLVDTSLASHNAEELVALVEIVKQCTNPKPLKRPTMAKVTEMLAAALKISQEDASLGSSGKIDYKSSPLMWAKLELLNAEGGTNTTEEEEDHHSEGLTSSTLPLLAPGPSSPKSGLRSPKSSSPKGCSTSGSEFSDSRPSDEVAITITSSQVKQFHQSDSKSFER
ncbi:hypothetical protein MPTK1_5g11430 [Marchantia polymorpha subsp. ruderalis]|uniref:Protein kinase domain-containing protein n=2 Tax=Marchantia polymorpha TaxID=3197 RepID=A0AAF6BH98_MARPO|nr:hypothetical protein Mp_5g11430 [Marchantia polymorpha subsp. ruderalis]